VGSSPIVHEAGSWAAARIIRDAVIEFVAGRGVLDIGTVGYFVRHAIEAGISSGRRREVPLTAGLSSTPAEDDPHAARGS
jgi:hypothetical protein